MTRKPNQPRNDHLGRLGSRIRAARERRDLSVPEAAALAEVSAATWYKWEDGSRHPDLQAVARVLRTGDPMAGWPE